MIARKYLTTNFDLRIKKLILIGTPVRGTNAANFLNYILGNKQLTDLKKNSEFFRELNEKWEKSENIRKVKVVNVATKVDPYTSIRELVEYWKPASDELIVLKWKLHYSLILPKDHSDKVFEVIKNSVINLNLHSLTIPYELDNSNKIVRNTSHCKYDKK